ncbi:hypothetical protein BRADI_2g16580v3 [Brachypodium distachyon]|nr:hypothetical protein BRADI_2g16580v3 [Brachypodium distachyon]
MLELLASYEDCAFLAEAVKAVPQIYQPSDQPTDFKKLIEAEVTKIKGNSRVSGHCQQLVRQFREVVWDVHHAGQPMPGDEQEELVMTSTQRNILNIKCPITMKPIIELTDPVRWKAVSALLGFMSKLFENCVIAQLKWLNLELHTI